MILKVPNEHSKVEVRTSEEGQEDRREAHLQNNIRSSMQGLMRDAKSGACYDIRTSIRVSVRW